VANARLNSFSDVETLEPLIAMYENISFVLTHMADGNVKDVLRLSRTYKMFTLIHPLLFQAIRR